ncbi:hypothetical protein ARSEF4850_000846 [Beauveria asiatica]
MDVTEVDDSDDDVYVRSRHRHRRQRQRSASVASTSTTLPDTADADNDYCEIVEEDDAEPDVLFASEVIDLTKDDSQRLILPHRPNETELESIVAPCGLTVKPTNCIQISDTYLGELKINFLQVTTIIRDYDGRTFIRGIPFTRPGQKPDPPVLVDVEPQRVIRWRTLIITNAPFPAHAADMNRYARSRSLEQKRIAAEKSAHIVCRWGLTVTYSITAANRNKAEEELLEHLRSDDLLDAKYRVSDNKVSELWRGPRQRGGGWKTTPESLKSLDTPISRGPGQTYTLFDSFSGAGGVSRGAQDAGFKIRYAIDKERERRSNGSQSTSSTYLRHARSGRQHTHMMDPTMLPILKRFTRTFGITHAKHVNHFWALIRDFTDLGYSVRWSVIRLCTWGSPQDRKRLIMIASAPGEQAPPFPAPTHSEYGGNGTKPFNTVASTLARVRRGDSLHNPEHVQSFHPPRPSWDANTLGRTITTGGANSYHPSGRRDFTLRELACLQGFPKTHEFVGTLTKIRRQIGNAFPPNTVHVLYKHLHDWLLKQDNVYSHVPEDDVMVIDDEDSDVSGSESVILGEARVSPDMDDVVMGQSDDEVIFVGRNADCDDDCFVDLT